MFHNQNFFLIDTHYTHVLFALLIPFFTTLWHLYCSLFFLLQFRDFSLTPYAPAPAPAHAPAAAPASAPATGSAGHAHGLEASEEVPIVSSLDEWLKQPAQIDIQEV
jgi:hypothetical protein